MSYADRLIRIAQVRYINRDIPVPLDLLFRLHAEGIYFDTLTED